MVSPLVTEIAYIGLFGATTLVCLGSLTGLRQIEHTDTRRGLGALLSLSSLWAASQIGHLLAPYSWVATAVYTTGLIVGLATVGAWLYFCSAYAGRSYHKKTLYRRLAIGIYLLIVVFKLTNPWHGLYFDTTTVTTPFRYIAIREQPVFWVVAGLAYVLSAAGFYMLIDVLEETRSTPRAAKAVVGLAAVPVIFDLVGYFSPSLILELNYESVGVGLFAIGALYVVREPFFAVSRYGRTQLIDTLEDAVVILDADDQVQDYNHAAIELFSNLTEGNGLGMEEISAIIDTRALSDGGTVELDRNGETRYFIIRTTPITVGETEIGRGVIFTDVTEIERQRRELQRKDDQLEGFATAITHELRNSVGIVSGQAELLSRIAAETDDSAIRSRTEKIVDEVSDMEEIVKQLRILAQYSQTISETEYVNLGDVARTAKRQSNVDDVDLEIEDSIVVEADQDRLRELFKQALLFAAQTGVSEVEVSGDTKSLRIKYDGRLLEDFDDDAIFAYGNAVPDSDSAMFLPNLQMIATSHGWELELAYENNKTVITIKTKNS